MLKIIKEVFAAMTNNCANLTLHVVLFDKVDTKVVHL